MDVATVSPSLPSVEEEDYAGPASVASSDGLSSPAPSPAESTASSAASEASSTSAAGADAWPRCWPGDDSRRGAAGRRRRRDWRDDDVNDDEEGGVDGDDDGRKRRRRRLPLPTHRSPVDEALQSRFASAASRADCAEVERILSAAAPGQLDIDRYGADGRTALLRACSSSSSCSKTSSSHTSHRGRGQLDLVRLLVRNGADLSLRTREGWSALHVAAFGDSPELVAYLVGCGGDKRGKGNQGGEDQS